MKSVAILCAVYNRFETSQRGFGRLYEGLALAPDWNADVFVLDDASPDGSGPRLKAAFPDMVVTTGTGNLFWNRGMCRAYASARESGRTFDAYLLFNDDVLIEPEKLRGFLDAYVAANEATPTILVGSFVSAKAGHVTYSGFRRSSRWSPLSVERVFPHDSKRDCDSFNGNFVVIPAKVMDDLGGLDPTFHHSYGDLDFGYRARAAGIDIEVWEQPIGHCEWNMPILELLARLPFRKRARKVLIGAEGIGEYLAFTRKHASAIHLPVLLAGRLIRITRTLIITEFMRWRRAELRHPVQS